MISLCFRHLHSLIQTNKFFLRVIFSTWSLDLVSLLSWAMSDIGKKRANNEDCFFHSNRLGLFIVADGMGGHKAGAFASSLAVKTASFEIVKNIRKNQKSNEAILQDAAQKTAKKVFLEGKNNIELNGMGTTLSMLLIKDGQAFISHVGDSRVYCLRNKTLKLLTTDHSLVNEQVMAGILSKEEARISHLRNVITKAIGHKEEVLPDSLVFLVEPEDIFLLCTDGLNSMLKDEQIQNILNDNHPSMAINELVKQANNKGGDDNITVVIVNII